MARLRFILNDEEITIDCDPNSLALDYIRNIKNLKATKAGCREGDCGACMVLLGELDKSGVKYVATESCMLAIGQVNGKHLVTIEGINPEDGSLNPIQQEIVDLGATQCGFCTPGVIVSLTSFFLNLGKHAEKKDILVAVEGNVCRCTGNVSIKRAAELLYDKFSSKINPANGNIKEMIKENMLPDYFEQIKEKLRRLKG